MPFVSRAQQRWGHTAAGEKALGGKAKLAEWDSATPKGASVPQYSKGDGGAVASYAKGGAVQAPGRSFSKTGDGRFQKGGSKKADGDGNDPTLLPNKRTDGEGADRLGTFLGGGDRFTSQNFAEQGDPASMQRIKPDENWTKEHVKGKNPRIGDDKSQKPVLPRGGGKKHGSIQGG